MYENASIIPVYGNTSIICTDYQGKKGVNFRVNKFKIGDCETH